MAYRIWKAKHIQPLKWNCRGELMKAPMRMLPLGKMSSGGWETTIDQYGRHPGRRAGPSTEEIEDKLSTWVPLCLTITITNHEKTSESNDCCSGACPPPYPHPAQWSLLPSTASDNLGTGTQVVSPSRLTSLLLTRLSCTGPATGRRENLGAGGHVCAQAESWGSLGESALS